MYPYKILSILKNNKHTEYTLTCTQKNTNAQKHIQHDQFIFNCIALFN